jgi:AAA family ATP:ADP antiporter
VTEQEAGSRDLGTLRRVVASFCFFGLLLGAYYLVRPVRDALVAGIGSESIKYLSTLVLLLSAGVAAVYALLVTRIPRRWFVPGLYALFALALAGFSALFQTFPDSRLVAEAFYLWIAVFNLWMVATFWSFMADLWPADAAERHFGRIAAGGSAGGLLGPWLAHHFAGMLGPSGLTLVAAAGLLLAALVAHAQMRGSGTEGYLRFTAPVGGRVLSGLQQIGASPTLRAIAVLVAGGSILGMFLYIEVAKSAAHLYPDVRARTAFFAERDLWVNAAAGVVQFALASALIGRLGAARVLGVVAVVTVIAFATLGLFAQVGTLLGINIVLRTLEFGLAKPSRDALYAQLDADAKYKSKNLIDTVFYRACDSTAGWLHAVLTAAGAGWPGLGGLGVVAGWGLWRATRRLPGLSPGR